MPRASAATAATAHPRRNAAPRYQGSRWSLLQTRSEGCSSLMVEYLVWMCPIETWCRLCPLLDLQADPLDESPETFVFTAEHFLVLLQRRARGLHADRSHALHHLGRLDRVDHRAVEPRDDLARGARGDKDAQGSGHVEPGIHGLGDRGHLGCEARAPGQAESEHAQLPGLHGARRGGIPDETEQYVSRHHRRDRLARALERYVGEIDAQVGFEQLHGDLVDRADARGRIGHRLLLRPGE